ncbi:MAG: serine/threonine-protein kinase, partial [Planctomycetes bacterium]|nr:serine/threonine-protein kinase [Planctomycetota bacterium]
MTSPRALKRFEYEAELLGRLSHEGVARIYEAGTASSEGEVVPFFAMEHVVGSSLLDHASEQALSVRDRMRLLSQVAEAVHHAHQKGVVHRDLKPANILVTREGQPKVLDFGVARATDGDLQASRPETAVDQLLGTLAYMSPEQASGDSRRLDARADVYALGVIGFQLLTDGLPHVLTGMSLPEAARCVAERPPRRLSDLRSDLPSDLELVISVALDPDPARRYPSAHALASDIARWLRHEPVSARPASAGYLVGRFVRRHRVGVFAAAVALLGLIGWTYGMWRARTEEHQAELARRAAESEAQGAREMFEIWLATFEGQAPGEGVTIPMLERLEETVAGLETRYRDRPELAGELHLTIGYTFLRFGEFEKALERIDRGVAAYSRAFGENHEETLNARANMANAYAGMRDADSAVSLLRDVRARAMEHLGPENRVSLFVVGRLGSMLAMAGELAEARVMTEDALKDLSSRFGDQDHRTLSTRYTLASLLRREGEYELALEHAEGVVAAFQDEELFARQPGLKWSAMAEQARILSMLDRAPEALEM